MPLESVMEDAQDISTALLRGTGHLPALNPYSYQFPSHLLMLLSVGPSCGAPIKASPSTEAGPDVSSQHGSLLHLLPRFLCIDI